MTPSRRPDSPGPATIPSPTTPPSSEHSPSCPTSSWVCASRRGGCLVYSDPDFDARLEAARSGASEGTPVEDVVPGWPERLLARYSIQFTWDEDNAFAADIGQVDEHQRASLDGAQPGGSPVNAGPSRNTIDSRTASSLPSCLTARIASGGHRRRIPSATQPPATSCDA